LPAGARLNPVYSVIIPLFNKEAVLPILLSCMDRLLQMLDGPAEVIFVDDGSTNTCGIVAAGRAMDDPRYRCRVAFAFPSPVTSGLGFPSVISIALTCVVAPVLNAVALSRFVFRAPLLDAPPVGVAPFQSETQT